MSRRQTSILLFMASIFLLSSCTSRSDSNNSGDMAAAKQDDEVEQSAKDIKANDPIAPAGEDLAILKKMIPTEMEVAIRQLDVADKLTLTQYETGKSISAADCAHLEKLISKNYSLHSYEAHSPEKGDYREQGIRLCPTESLRSGAYIDVKTASVHLAIGNFPNSLGVAASRVITVAYTTILNTPQNVTEQFLLDSKNRIVQYSESRPLSNEGTIENWNQVSALSKEGHILAHVYRKVKMMKTPYLWKSASTFLAGDGSISLALRVHQNDARGVDATKFTLDIPYQITWDKVEVSPLNHIRGYYQIGSEVLDSLNSKIVYDWVTRGADTCGYGIIGYTNGNAIRTFGDMTCEKKLDVNQTLF